MYDFSAEFGGKTKWLTTDGKPTELQANATKEQADAAFATASANAKIKVIPNYISGAIATLLKDSEKSYESPDLAFDYAVNNESKITLSVSGTPVALSSENAISGATHFAAFRILGVASANGSSFDSATASESTVKCNLSTAENGRQNISLIVPLTKDSAKTFTLTLKSAGEDIPTNVLTVDLTNVLANLSGVSASAIVTNTSYSLDNGGTYTVTYSAVGDFTFDETLNLYVSSVSKSIKTLNESISANKTVKIGSTEITKAEISQEGKTLTVEYKLPAPDLANLNPSNSSLALTIRKGNTTVISTNIKLDYVLNATNGYVEVDMVNHVFVKVSGNKMYAVKVFTGEENLRASAISFPLSLNIENENAVSYNAGARLTVVNGAVVGAMADSNLLSNATTVKLVSRGAVENANDTDEAALLIAEYDLTALGIRATSKTDVFHFTVNEDVTAGTSAAGNNTYTIYTVAADDAITSQNVTPEAARVNRQAYSCLTDGIDAYKLLVSGTEGGEDAAYFYYGAKVTAATGAHTWGEYSKEGVSECTVCHALNFRIAIEGEEEEETSDYRYSVVALPANKPVANPDTADGAWWGAPTADIAIPAGDFVIRYSWENTNGGYPGCGAIEMHDAETAGNYFGFRAFEADYNPGTSVLVGEGGTYTDVFKMDGEVLDDIIDQKPENDNDFWKGAADVTVYRIGNTLTFVQTLKTTAHTFEVTTTVTAFTDKAVWIHINGDEYWCNNLQVSALGTVAKEFTKTGAIEKDTAIEAIDGAVANGLSISLDVDKLTGDWNTHILVTAKDMRVCLMNIDTFTNTGTFVKGNGYPDWRGNGTDSTGTKCNGFTDGAVFYNNAYYLTVSISVQEGVKFFKNGVLLVWYKPEAKFLADNTTTIAQFCESVLGEVEESGFTLFQKVLGEKEVEIDADAVLKNVLISTAMNDKQAEQQYKIAHPDAD